MDIKWIISDLDGTIMEHHETHGRRVAQSTIDDLNKAGASNKYKVTIATGRHYLDAYKFLTNHGFKLPKNSYVIGSNGAQVYDCDKNELIYKKTLSDNTKKLVQTKMRDYFEKNFYDNYVMLGYGDKNEMVYVKNVSGEKYKQLTDNLKEYEKVDESIFTVMDADNFDCVDKLYKALVVIDTDLDYPKVISDLKKIDPNINVLKSLEGSLEIIPLDVDKREAVEFIQKNFYKIDAKEIIYFGDSFNDYEMLKYAGTSVTRASADKKIQSVCTHVIDAPASDFVADGLEMLLDLE